MISPQQGQASSASIQENNTAESLDGLMFFLQGVLPGKKENIAAWFEKVLNLSKIMSCQHSWLLIISKIILLIKWITTSCFM